MTMLLYDANNSREECYNGNDLGTRGSNLSDGLRIWKYVVAACLNVFWETRASGLFDGNTWYRIVSRLYGNKWQQLVDGILYFTKTIKYERSNVIRITSSLTAHPKYKSTVTKQSLQNPTNPQISS
jgi:hypothetical protein